MAGAGVRSLLELPLAFRSHDRVANDCVSDDKLSLSAVC